MNDHCTPVADDLFLFAALGFVAVCYFIFFALRHMHSKYLYHWNNLIDALFLFSLTLTLVAGFTVVYEFM